VINQIRESARRAQCASNLRQIYAGAQAYASAYNGALPGVTQWAAHDSLTNEGAGDQATLPWSDAMYREMFRYIDRRLYKCPSDQSRPSFASGTEDWRTDPEIPAPGTPDVGQTVVQQKFWSTSYFIFMGPCNYPAAFLRVNDGAKDSNLYPPLLGPAALQGYRVYRGCVMDNTIRPNGFGIHCANMKDVRAQTQIFLIDRHWCELAGYLNTDWRPEAAATHEDAISCHPVKKTRSYDAANPTNDQIIMLAAGANALLSDGSVRWIPMKNASMLGLYHQDYNAYHSMYSDQDMLPRYWTKK
jgi:hypothetical protein